MQDRADGQYLPYVNITSDHGDVLFFLSCPVHAATVLVVDDDQFLQRCVVALLRQLGHSGAVASDGRAALACLASRQFDLVLMDVTMPVLDGLATLARLRQAEGAGSRRQRIVMMTAHDAPSDIARLYAAGADGYLAKPIDRSTFAREIARVLDEKECP